MRQASNKQKIFFVAALVIGISVLHYITKMQQVYSHIFYRELYFLPLILASFWFGLRGGLATSLGVTILYLPMIIMNWKGLSPDDFDRILETLLFNIVAIGLGFISDKGKKEEKARTDAERMAREEAESANRLKSDFLSIMSHELRTPLISIIGYNDLLMDGVAGTLTEEQTDALKKIDKNSKKLLELINAVLDLSSLEAGRSSFEPEAIRISDLMEEVKSETEDLQKSSGLDFVWNIEPALSSLHTDRVKLKLVLKNLISNAAKFTEKGSITVETGKSDDGFIFNVTDTGIGIAPELLPVIFEPFRQGENVLTRGHGGAGMGLYIVRRLLEMLGGEITVKSEPGRGSTFRVYIPAVRS